MYSIAESFFYVNYRSSDCYQSFSRTRHGRCKSIVKFLHLANSMMSYFEIWHAFKEGPNVCWDVPKNTFFYFNQLKRRVFWEHLNKLRPSYIFRAFLSSKISLNPHATVPCPPNKVKSLLFILF